MKNVFQISQALDAVRKQKGTLRWNDSLNEQFEKLKDKMAKCTMLSHPDDSKKYVAGTDASTVGIGAWIGQYHGETLRIISYASRALPPAEKKYPPTQLGLLAIVFSLDKFHSYIALRRSEFRTDHTALTYLFTQTHLNSMMVKLFEKLKCHEFDIMHIAGEENVIADALSRLDEPISFAVLHTGACCKG